MRRMARAIALVVGLALLPVAAVVVEAQIYTRRSANGVVEATNVPDASGYLLTYPGKGTLIHSRGFLRSYGGQFDAIILEASSLWGLAPDLIKAVIQVESEFDQFAVSSKGAQGLMQLMPATARRFGVTNAFDARQNVIAGCQYLGYLIDLFDGDLALALAGYNAGENAVLRYKGVPPYRETRAYVDKIQRLFRDGWSPHVRVSRARNVQAKEEALTQAMFFTPSGGGLPGQGAHAQRQRKGPAKPTKPGIYYKWKDEQGILHVASLPPGEGVVYSMIRAFD